MDLREVFEPVIKFVKGFQKKERDNSKIKAKERLQLVLMQDRASVSPDFFEMMKKEIIEVIKKYIEIDEEALEVQLMRGFEGGLEGPALYANIPIKNVKPVAKKVANSTENEKKADKELLEEDAVSSQSETIEDAEELISEENLKEEDIVQEESLVQEEEVVENKSEVEVISTEENKTEDSNVEKVETDSNTTETKSSGNKKKSKK